MTAEDLSNYGNNKLLKLLNHYGSNKVIVVSGRVIPAVVDPMKTKMEWSFLKDVKQQQYPTGKLSMLWSCIFKFHPDTFPNLLKLVQLALTLPLQTADVERGFSAQNLIKTAHRYRMEENTLDNLMTISVEGPAVERIDFKQSCFLTEKKKGKENFQEMSFKLVTARVAAHPT